MTFSRNAAIAASIIVLSVLAMASNAGAAITVDEMSGSFGIIESDATDEARFSLSAGAISQSAVDDISGFGVYDMTVDVTGWTANGDDVAVVGGMMTIENMDNATTAVFDIVSVTLTQILTDPLAIGYMELELTQNTNTLTTDTADVILPSAMLMVISYNGLTIETDGTATLNATGSASFSTSATSVPVPEPATMAMLLTGLVFLRKRAN